MSNLQAYDEEQARARLGGALSCWTVEQGHLRRRYVTSGWRASMLLANGIAHLAELAWHHPDLHIAWGSVTVDLSTHEADAITDRDFELAAMIERQVTWRPDSGGALDGTPRDGQWRLLAGDD